MDFRNEVLHLRDELVFLRRDFHRNPELGYEEFLTSQKIIKYLTEIGIKVKKVTKTGVVGLLEGGMPGGTVLLRADMDALAIQEMNDVSYKSLKEGKMHACGHDGHMAMLLIAAKILSRHRDRLKGQVKFVFQPNEETAGALDMIKEGVLNGPQVDAAFGIHLWSPLPTGAIGIVAGPIMAANEEFELKIFGKGGHTSAPENAVDPIIAASIVVQTIQTIQTREVSALAPTVIMFGKIRGGTGRNIIAEQVELGGTIRFLYENEDQEKEVLKERFERVIAGICQATRTSYDLTYIPSNPSIHNDPVLVELVKSAAKETLNNEKAIVNYACLAGEDFAEFSRRVPSAFYFVGTGNQEQETDYPHHHPRFNIDEDSLPIGVEMHLRTVWAFLNR